jgi:hypothetical protein
MSETGRYLARFASPLNKLGSRHPEVRRMLESTPDAQTRRLCELAMTLKRALGAKNKA